MTIPYGPQVHPYLTMVRCDDHTLQIGVVKDEAVTVTVPENYCLDDVMWLLTRCDGTRSLPELVKIFGDGKHKVMDPADLECLLHELQAAGVAHLGSSQGKSRKLTVGVAGKGELMDEIRRLLMAENVRVVEWQRARQKSVDVVLVAESIVPDPLLIHSLLRQQQPFLLCTVVDNRGVVGPLISPKVAPPEVLQQVSMPSAVSYLPALVAARLAKEKGRASPATLSATAAFTISMLLRSVVGTSVRCCHEQWVVTPDAGVMFRTRLD